MERETTVTASWMTPQLHASSKMVLAPGGVDHYCRMTGRMAHSGSSTVEWPLVRHSTAMCVDVMSIHLRRYRGNLTAYAFVT
jgi:hypothetical protein